MSNQTLLIVGRQAFAEDHHNRSAPTPLVTKALQKHLEVEDLVCTHGLFVLIGREAKGRLKESTGF
jgi:hypothetical protein